MRIRISTFKISVQCFPWLLWDMWEYVHFMIILLLLNIVTCLIKRPNIILIVADDLGKKNIFGYIRSSRI